MYTIQEVRTRQQLRSFVDLPLRLHAHESGFVPNLISDDARLFDRRKNPAAAYCSASCWIATDARGRVVGRIAGIINHRYNQLRDELCARFSHLDSIDEVGVVEQLLATVRDWAKSYGIEAMIGPMGFTDQDPEGFMIEGFQEAPSIVTYCNTPFMIDALEGLGWRKYTDYVVYKVPLPAPRPRFYERMMARVRKNTDLRLVEFMNKRELKSLAQPILSLMNETYEGIRGYSPLSQDEIADLTKRFLPMIDPRFVKTVFAGDELVGFVIGVPDMAPGFRRARGRLFPTGWFWILRSAQRAERLDLLLGGIKREYRGRGVDLLLATAMFESAELAGYDHMDSHHELEDNLQVRAEMERWGGFVYKRYRIFTNNGTSY